MTAVRRTAQFFLNSFEERLAAQKKEKEMATLEPGFKKPLSKEEKGQKKKERLAAIGEDLLAIAADQPFRFPKTFTFVVRAFSVNCIFEYHTESLHLVNIIVNQLMFVHQFAVLDGIGKGLDPRFDITEIARPYAVELLNFREVGVEVVLKDFRKRWDRQFRAFSNLFGQADRVDKLCAIIERPAIILSLSRRRYLRAVVAGTLVNLATILYLHSIRVPAVAAYAMCALFGLQALAGILKVKRLDQRERLITGTA